MTPDALSSALEATWPPARRWALGPFTLRDGAGGGQRVAAASVTGAFTDDDLAAAIGAMPDPLFVLYPGDEALDEALGARGFRRHDPVLAYAAPVAQLAGEVPFLAAFPHWPALEVARTVWAEGGIGPARLQVMERADVPKSVILARAGDRPAGACFIACDGPLAILHAVEVRPAFRRQGAARHLLRAAANWAGDQGAQTLALFVTEANAPARALYAAAGMQEVGRYHYRKP